MLLIRWDATLLVDRDAEGHPVVMLGKSFAHRYYPKRWPIIEDLWPQLGRSHWQKTLLLIFGLRWPPVQVFYSWIRYSPEQEPEPLRDIDGLRKRFHEVIKRREHEQAV